MERRTFIKASAAILVPFAAEYVREVATLDPYPEAEIDNPTLLELAIARLTRPAMTRFATDKYTHDPDWTLLPYRPDFEDIVCTLIPGDPNLKPRRHGLLGLYDSITISLGAWPNRIDLVPDKLDVPWNYYFREGTDFVRKCHLEFNGIQSVIQGNESYEAFGFYKTGDLVNFTPSEPKPRNLNTDRIHLI